MIESTDENSLSVLALDSAGSACSAALLMDGRMAARRWEEMAHGQAEALIPMVQAVMKDADARFEALDLVAATVGPGSYTGVRVGLAAAQALASAAGKPLTGVSSFDAVRGALAPVTDSIVLIALETRRDDIYVQLFEPDGRARGAPAIAEAQALANLVGAQPTLVAGDAAERALAALVAAGCTARGADGVRHADAAVVAGLAARRFAAEGGPRSAEPIYLRAADALTPAERATRDALSAATRLVPARPVHGAVVAELQGRAFDERWSAEAVTALLGQPGVFGYVLVLADAELPIGYVLLRAAGGEAEILSLAVDSRHRRRGHGQRLVEASLAAAARAGAAAVFLEVGERNRAARSLYGRLGFREVGRRTAYYRGPRGVEDALTYRRDLAAPPPL